MPPRTPILTLFFSSITITLFRSFLVQIIKSQSFTATSIPFYNGLKSTIFSVHQNLYEYLISFKPFIAYIKFVNITYEEFSNTKRKESIYDMHPPLPLKSAEKTATYHIQTFHFLLSIFFMFFPFQSPVGHLYKVF